MEQQIVALPKPKTTEGKPLMQALKQRQSARSFNPTKLSIQTLSNLLWAASGVNRESGLRTAPSTMNWQEISIYVATANNLFVYDPDKHALQLISEGDIREATGVQPFVKTAPVNLVYVADYSRMGDVTETEKDFYSAADTGFISQNVYLFCSSEGLATVVRGSIDRDALARTMGLRSDQKIIFAQTVGAPGDPSAETAAASKPLELHG